MKTVILLLSAFLVASPLLRAAEADHADAHSGPAPASSAGTDLVDGTVRRVDKDTGRVTVQHGPIRNLEMPAMTMVFRVKDPGMLDRLKAGDKIQFVVEKTAGALTITEVRPAQ